MKIIFSIILTLAVISIVNKLRLKFTGNKILVAPTNELVDEYINILRFTPITNKPSVWGELRDVFFKVYNSKDISIELKETLYIKLVKKGCNIGKANYYTITDEEKIRKSGEEGERNIAYKLKWLSSDYKILSNIRLKSEIESQEFDNIIIGPNGIFHIETKNYGGEHGCKIKIDNSGNWVKEKNGRETGIDSPEFQLRRHEIVLQENLKKLYGERKFDVKGIIVLSNPKTVIDGVENLDVPVLKGDGLCKYIEGVQGESTLSSEEINDIYNKLKE
ncbi:hypothetical protein [Clostridium tertium]|uniref:Nuclease-related domain protein n=1 Tax=Clostridium tertium TaxID=1559 RepID=A0A6N3FYP3_9CLOT